MKRSLPFYTIVLLSLNSAFAQDPDLSALNKAFNGQVTFKMDKHDRLVMDHFDQNNRFRQDIVRIQDLDPNSVAFSAEENGIALKCLSDKAQCISKEIFKLNVVRATSRVTLPRPDQDVQGEQVVGLFRDLVEVRLADEPKPETPTRSPRKNPR